jgi:hypothetical protein
MQKKHFALLLAIALFLALSGCIDSLSAEQRQYCLSLTEKSYAFVPECKDEKQCFSQLEKSLFAFDQSVFGSETQSRLYSYKNSVASSWLSFNNARQNISNVHGICSGNKSLAGLIPELNDLTYNMSKAFEHADSANRESFAILVLEHESLEKENIGLAKEEPLFTDFALLSAELAEISSPSKCEGTESYACFYISQANGFAGLAAQTGFGQAIVSETNIFGLAQPHSSKIADYVKANLKIPFIESVLPSFIQYLSTMFTAGNAIGALEKVPAFQFLQSYNAFMGTGNSCVSKFSALLEQDALHRKGLAQRNSELEKSVSQGISAARQKISLFTSEEYSGFDREFFQKLYSGLGQESAVSAQKYSMRDFGELSDYAEGRLSGIEQSLAELQGRDALHMLSLGEKASSLKQLNLEIAELQKNVDYLGTEIIDGLVLACTERQSFIEKQLETAQLPEEYLSKAADLKARAKFRISLFSKAKAIGEKLFQCSEMIAEFERFSLALDDLEAYELYEESSLEGCFSFLESAFKNSEPAGINLEDFLLRYHELTGIEKPYEDVSAVKRVCVSLEAGVTAFIRQQGIISGIEESYSLSSKILPALENAESKGLISPAKMKSLKSQKAHFDGFFQDGKLAIEKALPVMLDLAKSLAEYAALLQESLEQSVLPFITENARISTLYSQEFGEIAQVSIENGFFRLPGPIALYIPFDGNIGAKTMPTSPSITSFTGDGKTLSIGLDCLPEGKTMLSFYTGNGWQEAETAPPLPEIAATPETQAEENSSQEDAEKILEGISSLESEISSAEETLSLLEGMFSNVSDEEIISAKYVLPISRAELAKIRLNLNSLKSFLEKKQLDDFRLLLEQGDAAGAMEKAGGFSAKLQESISAAKSAGSRLVQALDAIKEDAAVSFNLAAEQFNTNPGGEQARETLEKSERLLLDGSYLESIASSKGASALMALAPAGNNLNLPLLAIPFAACAALVLFVRFRKEKSSRQKEDLVQRIESNW